MPRSAGNLRLSLCNRRFVHYRTNNQSRNFILREKSSFQRERVGSFFQTAPQLTNTYTADKPLRDVLRRWIPTQYLQSVDDDLTRFGQRAATDIRVLGEQCERDKPYVRHYDAWGQRVDDIVTSHAWRRQHDISAEEGLVSIPYERQQAEWSRLYQAAKLYLYSPSSGLYSCPLAMTDGAASVLQSFGLSENHAPFSGAYQRLTSRRPHQFWTSGQWMTERRGGSDVANGTETLAYRQADGTYRLHGYKWFTSATDADMTLTLARVVGCDGQVVPGTKGLSLFYAETRDADGRLNNIQIQRLKDKLGTRQLPTAELLLDGLPAHMVSSEGRGVSGIAGMLTITRFHNALSAVSAMRRMLMLSRDYSQRREAFGRTIRDYPLHMRTLASMEVETRAALLLVMEVARLIGREEGGTITEADRHRLRLLTPLTKLYTGKQAVSVISEGLESFGGQGYMEDTGIPTLFRDAQVLSIWEGTTNVLSLDVLRGVGKSSGATLSSLLDDALTRLPRNARGQEMAESCERVQQGVDEVKRFVERNGGDGQVLEAAARDLAFTLTRCYAGALLLEHAASSVGSETDITAAVRWCRQPLVCLTEGRKRDGYSADVADLDTQLVMDGYS